MTSLILVYISFSFFLKYCYNEFLILFISIFNSGRSLITTSHVSSISIPFSCHSEGARQPWNPFRWWNLHPRMKNPLSPSSAHQVCQEKISLNHSLHSLFFLITLPDYFCQQNNYIRSTLDICFFLL